jgi:hypothetical protein
MTFDEFIFARDAQTKNNAVCGRFYENTKLMPSNEWENEEDVEEIFALVKKHMNDYNTDVLVSCGWYFNEESMIRMLEMWNESFTNEIKIFVAPERMVVVFFRNKDVQTKYLANMDDKFIRKSIFNIKNLHSSENGVEFIYTDHTSFMKYDEDVDFYKNNKLDRKELKDILEEQMKEQG